MNERFLELAKQAGLKFPSETALSPMEEKFAELIVRECGNYADWYQENYTDADIGKAIKRYFGVK